jgi:hypothetical protein
MSVWHFYFGRQDYTRGVDIKDFPDDQILFGPQPNLRFLLTGVSGMAIGVAKT